MATIEDLTQETLDEAEPEKTVLVGNLLEEQEKKRLIEFLKANKDVFAWSYEDMVGVDPTEAVHQLAVDSRKKPVKQRQRRFAPERNEIIAAEVDRLLKTGMIREVKYPDWLSNVVLVQKKNGKWRVCIDFTNLNKACPKDSYPLPKIDQMVDATTGYEKLSFLDAYSDTIKLK